MAPEWARATRPTGGLIFTTIALSGDHSLRRQRGGAGWRVRYRCAGPHEPPPPIAVTVSAWRQRPAFGRFSVVAASSSTRPSPTSSSGRKESRSLRSSSWPSSRRRSSRACCALPSCGVTDVRRGRPCDPVHPGGDHDQRSSTSSRPAGEPNDRKYNTRRRKRATHHLTIPTMRYYSWKSSHTMRQTSAASLEVRAWQIGTYRVLRARAPRYRTRSRRCCFTFAT